MSTRWLGKKEVYNLLEELEQSQLTAYCEPSAELEKFLPEQFLQRLLALRPRLENGLAIFIGPKSCAIAPPFPILCTAVYQGFNPAPLLQLLSLKPTIAIVLLRHGPYALGIFKGGELIASKCGKMYVGAKHRKGGASQRRFARRRQEQVKQLIKEVSRIAELKFKPYAAQVEWLWLGGEKQVCKQLLKQSQFLQQFRLAPRTLKAEPSKRGLEGILHEVWKFRVYEF